MKWFTVKLSLSKDKFFLLSLLLIILLRIPSLFEPYWYGDEGIALVLGQAINKGLILYRDIHDNKPPVLYLLAAFGGNLFYLKFILLISILIGTYFFYQLAKNLLPKQQKITQIITLTFIILSSLPMLEGNIANGEIFMIIPTIIGIFLIFKEEKITFFNSFFAGTLFSLAILIKVPAIFDFAAILFFFFFFKGWRYFFSKNFFLPITLGFLFPLLITIIFFWTQNALTDYLKAAFTQNIFYLSSWQTGKQTSFAPNGLMVRFAILILALLVVLFKAKKEPRFSFVAVWFLFSLFGTTLSSRPYPHYLIQAIPPLCLLIGVSIKSNHLEKIKASLFLTLFLATLFYFKFWVYPTISYYQNFLEFTTGQKNKNDYFSWFDRKVPQTYQLANFLVNHTQSNEKIFIWGDSALTYALSNRLEEGRYTTSYHIIDFNGYNETISAIIKDRPRYIIDLNDETRPFPQLYSLISNNYFVQETVGNARIYRLRI